MVLNITINNYRELSVDNRIMLGETVELAWQSPADGLRFALLRPDRTALAISEDGVMQTNTDALSLWLANTPSGWARTVNAVAINDNDEVVASGSIDVVSAPLPGEIIPLPEGIKYLKLTDCLDSISETSDYPVQSRAIATELNVIREKQFDISIDGITATPVNSIVNIPTNYSREAIQAADGVVTLQPNSINSVADATGITTITTAAPTASGVADYLLYIVIADGQGAITFTNGLGGKFLAPSDDVFALEVGVNLLSFTQVTESDLAVNRVLLKEVS